VLDLGHWLDLSDRASKRHKALQEQIGEIDKQLAYHRGVLAGLEDEAKLQQLHDAWETSYQADIDEAIGLVEQGEIEHAKRTKALTRMKRQRDALATVTNITKKIAEEREAAAKLQISLARTRDARTDAQTQLAFYSSHDACPTCQQTLTPAFIAKQSKRLQKELAQLEVEVEQLESQVKYYADSVRQLEADRDRQQQERQVLDRQIVAEETALRQIQASINQLAQRVEDMAANRQNPYAARLAELQSTKSRIDKALADYTGQRDQLQGECLLVDFWRNGFKRVRLFLVAQVLTSLEAEVASAASALGLPGWRIVFTTEKETKAGTTRPGIRVHVTSPHAQGPWEVWSGGELQRIRLSVAIGLSSLIQRMSGIYYTWEVWDEPSAWLSAEGIEDLLTALQYRAEVSDKAVWLLDHRALTFGGFSEIWQVQKTPEGSRIALLARDE
jgi:DNA repair exonuclease SbcCD ATPase subunit